MERMFGPNVCATPITGLVGTSCKKRWRSPSDLVKRAAGALPGPRFVPENWAWLGPGGCVRQETSQGRWG
jgi:hypothetical protein